MCCECCSVRQQQAWVVAVGVVCVVFGMTLIIVWPGVTEAIINHRLPLAPDSWMYPHWLQSPMTTFMFVYLFNWTNLFDASNPAVKPNFLQRGPYVFREERAKEDVTWHDNDTMTFYARRTWFFEPDMSVGTLDDLITLPHPPSVAVAHRVRNWNHYMKKIMNFALNTEGGCLAVNRTVEEWLFKGFYDPLGEFAMLLESKLIPWFHEKFGFFVGRNGSKDYDGAYTIHTGQQDLSMLGELWQWRGSNQTYAFRGECGRVNGSTGDIFAPSRGPSDTVSVFITDTCRAIHMQPGEKRRMRGIDTVKYSADSMSFDSGQRYPSTECFCSVKSKTCAPTGAIDLGPCYRGVPLYLSQPHFLDADPSYLQPITGMEPDPEKHGFYMYMEPRLGVPVNVNMSIQISMRLTGDDIIEIFKNVNEFYAPMVIVSERGDLDESMAKLVRIALRSPAIGVSCGIALTAIGVVLLLVAGYWTYKVRSKEKKDYI